MSTELNANGPLAVTRFFGGAARGPCVQLSERIESDSWRFVQVSISNLPALIADLQAVVDGTIGEEE